LGNSHTIKADTRIITATNRDLEEEVHRGNFRKDLWYRLDVFPITLPPLRERTDDIPLLVDFMIQKFTRKLGRQIQAIPSKVMKTLQTYAWPGNVRELENVIERAVINTRGSTLQLAEKLVTSQVENSTENQWIGLEQVERDYIFRVLEETRWKIEGRDGAARILDLNPSTLRGRMRKLGIQRP
jgi:chemotaxis protein methyltransferase CheR